MSLFQSLILGIVQGLTEFIPVSSSAHLILVPWLLGWKFDPTVTFIFDILLQLGTLAAVIVYFWKDLWAIARAFIHGLIQRKPFESSESRLGWLIIVAGLPLIVGLVFKDFFEGLHSQPVIVAIILMVAASLLFASERIGRRARTLESLTWLDALVIGFAQTLALLPGVSRSAATISGGLARDLDRPSAARFSFILSVPVMLGASAVAIKDLIELPNFMSYLPPLVLGFIASAIVGYLGIHWLLSYISKRSLNVFAWYRIVAGFVCLAVFFLRR